MRQDPISRRVQECIARLNIARVAKDPAVDEYALAAHMAIDAAIWRRRHGYLGAKVTE
jgi:hypothetical protein